MKTVNLYIIIFVLSILFFSCNERGNLSILDKTYTVEYVDEERNLLGDGYTEKREIKEIKAQNDSVAAEDAYIGFLAKLKVMYKCCESGTDYITRPKFYYLYDDKGNLVNRVKGERREHLNNLVGKEVIECYLNELPPYAAEFSPVIDE